MDSEDHPIETEGLTGEDRGRRSFHLFLVRASSLSLSMQHSHS